ncbi:MAG TPA: GNAT family N-acetyltransferase [Tepidisphaeraceae bacterium]
MAINIRAVPVERILPLRHAILRPGLPAATARFDCDDAPDAVHFAAQAGDRLAGCATLCREPFDGEPAWRLRGMAVAADAQSGGVGRLLLTALDHHVTANGPPHTLWCNARLPAVGFYERCGWAVVSDVFDIPTAGPHRRMTRRLEISPTGPTVAAPRRS